MKKLVQSLIVGSFVLSGLATSSVASAGVRINIQTASGSPSDFPDFFEIRIRSGALDITAVSSSPGSSLQNKRILQISKDALSEAGISASELQRMLQEGRRSNERIVKLFCSSITHYGNSKHNEQLRVDRIHAVSEELLPLPAQKPNR